MFSINQSVVAFSSLIIFVNASAKCYYSNGQYQSLDTPCNPNSPESNCCGQDDICLSNSLCYRAKINRFHRGVRPSLLSFRSQRLTSSQNCTDQTFPPHLLHNHLHLPQRHLHRLGRRPRMPPNLKLVLWLGQPIPLRRRANLHNPLRLLRRPPQSLSSNE